MQYTNGIVDFDHALEDKAAQIAGDGTEPSVPDALSPAAEVRVQTLVEYIKGNFEGGLAKWAFQESGPTGHVERAMMAEMNGWYGNEATLKFIEEHAKHFPLEADAIRARYEYANGHREESVQLLEKLFVAYRTNPWSSTMIMNRALDLARDLGQSWSPDAVRLFKALGGGWR
mgnify:CR=1 FL=1